MSAGFCDMFPDTPDPVTVNMNNRFYNMLHCFHLHRNSNFQLHRTSNFHQHQTFNFQLHQIWLQQTWATDSIICWTASRYTGLPTSTNTRLPTFTCTGFPTFTCTGLPTFTCTGLPNSRLPTSLDFQLSTDTGLFTLWQVLWGTCRKLVAFHRLLNISLAPTTN